MNYIFHLELINLIAIYLIKSSQAYNEKNTFRFLNESNNSIDFSEILNNTNNSMDLSEIFNEANNSIDLNEINDKTNDAIVLKDKINEGNIFNNSKSTEMKSENSPNYIEALVLGIIIKDKTSNNFNFLIYIAFNSGYMNSSELTLSSSLKYNNDKSIYNEEKVCTLSSSMNNISEYNCHFNLKGNKQLESMEIYDNIKFNDIKPNKVYLSTSAKYVMANLVENIDEYDFENIMKNGFIYSKNAHILEISNNSFMIEMDLNSNFNYLGVSGAFPTIDNKKVNGFCILEKFTKFQMECLMDSGYKSHFNNTIISSNVKTVNNFVIIFNENENDLIEIIQNNNNKNSGDNGGQNNVDIFSSSSSKVIIYAFIFIPVFIALIIITIICILKYKKRQRLRELGDDISQKSNSTEPNFSIPNISKSK